MNCMQKWNSYKYARSITGIKSFYLNTAMVALLVSDGVPDTCENKFLQDIFTIVRQYIGKTRVESLMSKIRQAVGYKPFCE